DRADTAGPSRVKGLESERTARHHLRDCIETVRIGVGEGERHIVAEDAHLRVGRGITVHESDASGDHAGARQGDKERQDLSVGGDRSGYVGEYPAVVRMMS